MSRCRALPAQRRGSASPISAKSRSARATILPSPAAFDTIFIDHVPVLAEGRRNEAKRFILLIDTLYDHHVRLVVSAEAAPQELYAGKRGNEASSSSARRRG